MFPLFFRCRCLSLVISSLFFFAAIGSGQTEPAKRPDWDATLRFESNDAVAWKAMFDEDSKGFTYFVPSRDGQTFFMSSSQGDDAGDGVTQPVRTLKKALTLLRNGYPDRLLLKRGDVFGEAELNQPFQCGGRSPSEPMMIGAYGDTNLPRPMLVCNLNLGGRAKPNFLVIQSLDFYADHHDPSLTTFDPAKRDSHQAIGLFMFSTGQFLWVEDCRIRFFGTGMVFQSGGDAYHGLIVRRCVIADNYNPAARAQGMYMENVDHVLIEENVFDHNGWNSSVPGAVKTIYNHNIYIQHGKIGDIYHILVRNNILARASSHGLQLRPGGQMENNLFLKNAMAAFVSYAPSVVRNNVVLGGDGIGANQPRGMGLQFLNCPVVIAERNIVAHKKDPVNTQAALSYNPIIRDAPPLPCRAEIRDNIVYDWSGPALETDSQSAMLNVENNYFQRAKEPMVTLSGWRDGYFFCNNFYDTSFATPFRIGKKTFDLASWCNLTGDVPGTNSPHFLDPTRDVPSYAASIGLKDATLEGFLNAAREQCRGHWDSRLTARAVNEYIRAGFSE
jgi:Right handed beta helix region